MMLQPRMEPARRRDSSRDDSGVRIAVRPSEPPPAPDDDALLGAAIAAEAGAPSSNLADFWQDVLDRRLEVLAATTRHDRSYLVAREDTFGGPRLTRVELAVVVRVLCGDQQKAVAFDLNMACSTTSKWYTRGIKKLRLDRLSAPLPLIVSAQAWSAGIPIPVAARRAEFWHGDRKCVVVSVPRPRLNVTNLTEAEREVATFLVEGETRLEIANRRTTSAQTIASQLRCIYSKLGVTGRPAMVKRGIQLGWFA